jgi:hypothetical protein
MERYTPNTNYKHLVKKSLSKIDFRFRWKKEHHEVEFFDWIRVNPDTIPKGKHMYHTRHRDNDWSSPVTIAPEGKSILVNFCGTIVTDKKFDIKEETKIIDVGWL